MTEPRLDSVTAAQMAEIDRALEESIGLPLASSVEIAGYHIANHIQKLLEPIKGKHLLTLVGSGHNGADALSTTRHLVRLGANAVILLDNARSNLKPTTIQQLEIAEQYGVRVFEPGALLPEADLIIDGLIGYGLEGSILQEATRELIFASAQYKVPHIAIDIPSGLDATTGRATTPAFRADYTITLGYPKTGLVKQYSPALVGELLVLDVGIPSRWWQRYDLTSPDFSAQPIIVVPAVVLANT